MKAAGIARAVVLATTLTLVGMLFAGVAGAAPLSKQLNSNSDELAVDGTDVYSTLLHTSKNGSDELVLFRGSFLNKSRVEIARFPGTSDGDVAGLSAGGGYAVLSLNSETFGSSNKKGLPTTKVLRIARDGSRRDVIGTGRIVTDDRGDHIVERGVHYLNDCGTRVEALGATDSGSVVMASAVSDRRSKACGRKKDVDHWRYYELRLDGTQREIFAKDLVVRSSYKRRKQAREFSSTSRDSAVDGLELVGDRALIRSRASHGYFVRNLVTGALTGPFGSSDRFREKIEIASLGSDGAVAVNSFSFSKRTAVSERIGIYPDSADPSVFKQRKSDTPLVYCGSHLLSVPISPSGKLQELDPLTFAAKRVLATHVPDGAITFGLEIGCDNNFTYAIDLEDFESLTLLAYPLN